MNLDQHQINMLEYLRDVVGHTHVTVVSKGKQVRVAIAQLIKGDKNEHG